MKITICGSITNSPKMLPIIKKLEDLGHVCLWSNGMERYGKGDKEFQRIVDNDHAKIKQEQDTIRWYYNAIKESGAILVCNFEKNGINGYIGGSVLMELGFAHVLDKKIFLLNEIPQVPYQEEIVAVKPTVINNNLGKIK